MKALFFDFDGVIADSRTAIGSCFDAVLITRGLQPLDARSLSEVIGPPLQDSFRTVLAVRGADPQIVRDCVRDYRALYARVSLEATTLQPGILATLRDLSKAYHLALATSKLLSLTEPLLERLGIRDVFAVVSAPTAKRDGESKTATLAHAADQLGRMLNMPIDQMIATMVGDRKYDIEAGKALGMRTIGVTWGAGSRAELLTAGADRIVTSSEDLPLSCSTLHLSHHNSVTTSVARQFGWRAQA
ncbi:MAG: HAD family hydrolase [Vulcanimicrobiaceae bacterium]